MKLKKGQADLASARREWTGSGKEQSREALPLKDQPGRDWQRGKPLRGKNELLHLIKVRFERIGL
jgi:hypothetical protein